MQHTLHVLSCRGSMICPTILASPYSILAAPLQHTLTFTLKPESLSDQIKSSLPRSLPTYHPLLHALARALILICSADMTTSSFKTSMSHKPPQSLPPQPPSPHPRHPSSPSTTPPISHHNASTRRDQHAGVMRDERMLISPGREAWLTPRRWPPSRGLHRHCMHTSAPAPSLYAHVNPMKSTPASSSCVHDST